MGKMNKITMSDIAKKAGISRKYVSGILNNKEDIWVSDETRQKVLALVKELGNPVITTSATRPDGTIFHDASLIHEYFGKRVDVVIDGSIVPGQPSSVILLINDIPAVIRKGLGDVTIFE